MAEIADKYNSLCLASPKTREDVKKALEVISNNTGWQTSDSLSQKFWCSVSSDEAESIIEKLKKTGAVIVEKKPLNLCYLDDQFGDKVLVIVSHVNVDLILEKGARQKEINDQQIHTLGISFK